MYGQVGTAFGHGDFQLLDEKTLATDVGERPIQYLIAPGRHAQDLYLTRRILRL